MVCESQRMDLGECPQIHDLALRADYEAAQKKKDHFYDIDVSDFFFLISNIFMDGLNFYKLINLSKFIL